MACNAAAKLSPEVRSIYETTMAVLQTQTPDPQLLKLVEATFDAFYVEGILRQFEASRDSAAQSLREQLANLKLK